MRDKHFQPQDKDNIFNIIGQRTRLKSFDSGRNSLYPALKPNLRPNSDDSLCHKIDSLCHKIDSFDLVSFSGKFKLWKNYMKLKSES